MNNDIYNKKISSAKIKAKVLMFFVVFLCMVFIENAHASQSGGTWVKIQYTGQVMDSLTYNGKTVNAIYPLYTPDGGDATYACFAYVTRFYSTIYGVSVSNMWGPGYIPQASSGSFSATTSPRVGDIIRFNNETHWAIVKSVASNGTVTVIQQNARYNGCAWVGAIIGANDSSVTYFTYSGNNSSSAQTAPTNSTISISKSTIVTGENVTFSVSANGATYYTLGIDKDGLRVATTELGGNKTYTCSFNQTGNYTAYVTAGNSSGYLDSTKINFVVKSPDSVLPSGAWILPQNGSTLNSKGTTNLSINATDNINMSKVTFHAYYDNAWHEIGQDIHGGNGTYSLIWNYNIFPQDVIIHAHLYDTSGNYKNIVGLTLSMKLAKPSGISSTSGGYNSVKLMWNLTPGASGYQIYRATSSNGTYSLIKEVTGNTFSDTGVVLGKNYYYKIRAVVTNVTTKKYSDFTSYVIGTPQISRPNNLKAVSSGYNRLTLSWASVSGATGYKIYQSSSVSGTYSLVKTVTGNSNVVTGLTSGKTYYFKIRAYRTVGTSTYYSSYTSVLNAKPVPAVPTTFLINSIGYNSIKLSWSSVEGASGYTIYRATSSNGTYSELSTVSSNYYSNVGLYTGKTYYYKVRAYRLFGTTKVYGNYTAVKSAFPSYNVTSRNYNLISRLSSNSYLNGYSDAATGNIWKVVTCPKDGSTEQIFNLTRQVDGSYKINITRYNRLVTIEGTVSAGTKLISSVDSGSLLQKFVLTRKDGDYYTISPLGRPDLVLSRTGTKTYSNVEHYFIQLETFNGGNNQYWKLEGV